MSASNAPSVLKPVNIWRELDPKAFYVNKAFENSESATGFERLAYHIFGYELIGSLAFALDPMRDFRVYIDRPKGKRRNRIKSFPPIRRSKRRQSNSKFSSLTHHIIGNRDNITNTTSTGTPVVTNLSSFTTVPSFSIDTVESGRPPGVNGGEFEKFMPHVTWTSPSVNRKRWAQASGVVCNHGNLEFSRNDYDLGWSFRGPVSTLSAVSQNQLRILEQERADQLFKQHGFSLITKTRPEASLFRLVRSIAEIKDLPRLADLSQIPQLLKDRTFGVKDLGSLILAKEFGLDPLISDIRRLLELPEEITKKVNFLISRNGLPTTFRRKLTGSEPIPFTPSWSSSGFSDTIFSRTRTSDVLLREYELRVSVNYGIKFPDIELPKLRKKLFDQLLGTNATFSDLYELTPWSWLIDWFSGLGNYLQAIEDMYLNPHLINDGWITYVSNGICSRSVTMEGDYENLETKAPGGAVLKREKRTLVCSGTTSFLYSYHKRVNCSQIGVPSVVGLENLTDFQSLILSALFAQKST